jgi:hypothetical protein
MLPFCTACISILLAGAAAMDSHNFVPGEALVQFRSGTPAGAALERAQRSTPPDLSALGPILKAAGAQVRVPLKAVRLAGGSWILLKIDADLLAKRTADNLRQRRGVRSVAQVPRDSSFFESGSQAGGLLIELAPGPEDSAPLIAALSEELGLPLVGGFRKKGLLLVEIDWKELTRILVDRLKGLDDIEAAQPNYILGIRPPS